MLDGLSAWLDSEGLDSLNEIIGVALPGPMPFRTAAISATDEADLLAMLRTDD